MRSLVVEDSFLNLMKIPHDVDANRVETKCLDHLYPMFPILRNNSRIMQLARINGQVLVDMTLNLINFCYQLNTLYITVEYQREKYTEND